MTRYILLHDDGRPMMTVDAPAERDARVWALRRRLPGFTATCRIVTEAGFKVDPERLAEGFAARYLGEGYSEKDAAAMAETAAAEAAHTCEQTIDRLPFAKIAALAPDPRFLPKSRKMKGSVRERGTRIDISERGRS